MKHLIEHRRLTRRPHGALRTYTVQVCVHIHVYTFMCTYSCTIDQRNARVSLSSAQSEKKIEADLVSDDGLAHFLAQFPEWLVERSDFEVLPKAPEAFRKEMNQVSI